jgi:hypothetical protein
MEDLGDLGKIGYENPCGLLSYGVVTNTVPQDPHFINLCDLLLSYLEPLN